MLHASADKLKGSLVKNIGPMGVPVAMMHPETIGVHAVALAEQLPGQHSLGLVRGAFLEQIGKQPATLEEMQEAVSTIRRIADEHSIDLPLYLGGFGPKLLKLAGQLGVDGVKLGGSVNPRLAEYARTKINNPDVDIVLGAVSVIDPDRKAARQLARQEVAKYLDVVGPLDPTLNLDDQLSLAAFRRRFREGDPEAGTSISNALLDKFAIAGTPEDAQAALEKMNGVVDRFEFGTPHGLHGRAGGLLLIGETMVKAHHRSSHHPFCS